MIYLGPGTCVIWESEGCSFRENSGFWQYFRFSKGNWAQKWTKTFNFGYIRDYLWSKFQQTCAIFGGEMAQKTKTPSPQKRWFCGYCIATKTFEHYHLAATNAYLMKLTTSMYLHMTLNLAEDWGVTHGA